MIVSQGADQVWHWLLKRGPHGDSFQWSSELNCRYDARDHLKRIIDEYTEADQSFPDLARQAALNAIQHPEPSIIRRGIQVLAIVGNNDDLSLIIELLNHPIKEVANDARSCLFERGIKRPISG